MAHRRSVRSLFLGFCLMLFATSVFAQQGNISGRITRTNGSGIGGVIVQVVELSKVELSDSNGNFRFAVPPGTYTVSFVAGDQAVTESNVAVAAGDIAFRHGLITGHEADRECAGRNGEAEVAIGIAELDLRELDDLHDHASDSGAVRAGDTT